MFIELCQIRPILRTTFAKQMFAQLKTGYSKPARPTGDVSSRDMRKIDIFQCFRDRCRCPSTSSNHLHSYNWSMRGPWQPRSSRTSSHHRCSLRTLAYSADQGGEAETKTCWTALEKVRTYCAQTNLHPPPREGEEPLPAGYVSDKIESSSSGKDLFDIKDQLSGKKNDSTLPSFIPTVDLSDTFGDFFSAKIQRLRDEHDATSGQPDFTKQKELKQSWNLFHILFLWLCLVLLYHFLTKLET